MEQRRALVVHLVALPHDSFDPLLDYYSLNPDKASERSESDM